jgi:hypothetical protein
MFPLVNLQGTWTSEISRNKNKVEKPGLVQQEQKSQACRILCPNRLFFLLLLLFPALESKFGSFGPIAGRHIFSLILKCGNTSGRRVPPCSPGSSADESFCPFRAICYRQTSARIGHAVANLTTQRPLLCVSSEFLVYLCPSLFLSYLESPWPGKRIISLLLFLSPMLPPLDPSPLLRIYHPLPKPLLRDSPLFLNALPLLLL